MNRSNEGGFHPVHLGDILDHRFEVVHKLGYGGFGLVWLCQELQNNRWRAVKILAAEYSPDPDGFITEGGEGDGRAWSEVETTQYLKAT